MDDLIRRHEVLEVYSDLYWADERLLNFKKELDAVYDKINNLLSAQSKRDIPKKPYEETDHIWGVPHKQPVCPNCDSYLTVTHFFGEGKKISYCEHCGQAIDWSEWDYEEVKYDK